MAKFDKCPYCGNTDLVVGYQSGQGSVYKKKKKFMKRGHRIEHLFCSKCGTVLYSRVVKPESFANKK